MDILDYFYSAINFRKLKDSRYTIIHIKEKQYNINYLLQVTSNELSTVQYHIKELYMIIYDIFKINDIKKALSIPFYCYEINTLTNIIHYYSIDLQKSIFTTYKNILLNDANIINNSDFKTCTCINDKSLFRMHYFIYYSFEILIYYYLCNQDSLIDVSETIIDTIYSCIKSISKINTPLITKYKKINKIIQNNDSTLILYNDRTIKYEQSSIIYPSVTIGKNGFSICFWLYVFSTDIKVNENNNSFPLLKENLENGLELIISKIENNQYKLICKCGNNSNNVIIESDRWMNIFISYLHETSTIYIYINGEKKKSMIIDPTNNLVSKSLPLYIGKCQSNKQKISESSINEIILSTFLWFKEPIIDEDEILLLSSSINNVYTMKQIIISTDYYNRLLSQIYILSKNRKCSCLSYIINVDNIKLLIDLLLNSRSSTQIIILNILRSILPFCNSKILSEAFNIQDNNNDLEYKCIEFLLNKILIIINDSIIKDSDLQSLYLTNCLNINPDLPASSYQILLECVILFRTLLYSDIYSKSISNILNNYIGLIDEIINKNNIIESSEFKSILIKILIGLSTYSPYFTLLLNENENINKDQKILLQYKLPSNLLPSFKQLKSYLSLLHIKHNSFEFISEKYSEDDQILCKLLIEDIKNSYIYLIYHYITKYDIIEDIIPILHYFFNNYDNLCVYNSDTINKPIRDVYSFVFSYSCSLSSILDVKLLLWNEMIHHMSSHQKKNLLKISLLSLGRLLLIDGNYIKCVSGFPTLKANNLLLKPSSGCWFYEVTLFSSGLLQIGWCDSAYVGDSENGKGVGDHSHSWAYDGYRKLKWNYNSEEYGNKWNIGDIIGCFIDMNALTITYYLNGISLGVAYTDINIIDGVVPAISCSYDQSCKLNFGEEKFIYPPKDIKYKAIIEADLLPSQSLCVKVPPFPTQPNDDYLLSFFNDTLYYSNFIKPSESLYYIINRDYYWQLYTFVSNIFSTHFIRKILIYTSLKLDKKDYELQLVFYDQIMDKILSVDFIINYISIIVLQYPLFLSELSPNMLNDTLSALIKIFMNLSIQTNQYKKIIDLIDKCINIYKIRQSSIETKDWIWKYNLYHKTYINDEYYELELPYYIIFAIYSNIFNFYLYYTDKNEIEIILKKELIPRLYNKDIFNNLYNCIIPDNPSQQEGIYRLLSIIINGYRLFNDADKSIKLLSKKELISNLRVNYIYNQYTILYRKENGSSVVFSSILQVLSYLISQITLIKNNIMLISHQIPEVLYLYIRIFKNYQ